MKLAFVLILSAFTGMSMVSAAPNFTQEQLYNLTSNFWDNFMYPKNCIQSGLVNSPLLADNIQGRIDVTRTFDGSELNTEYLFGIFCNLQSSTGFNVIGAPINYTFTQFVGQGNLVSNTVLIPFNISSLNLISYIQIQSFINFNEEGKMSQYDAVFKWMDWQFATLAVAAAKKLGLSDPVAVQAALTNATAGSICAAEAEYCVGDLKQYADTNACMSFLTTQIPFGEAWQLGMNTLSCRDIHVNMVPFRPDVHCSHIGPTGGGMCTSERDYTTYVTDPYFDAPTEMLQIPA